MKVLTLGVVMALNAFHALAADPQVSKTCSGTDTTQCFFIFNINTSSTPKWLHDLNYYAWIRDNVPAQTVDLGSDNLKLTVSGNLKNTPENTTGYLSGNNFRILSNDLIHMSNWQGFNITNNATGEFEMLPNSSATLSLQPEDSTIVHLGNVVGKIHDNVTLTLNPSYAEANKIDMTQFGEAEADDYQAGSAIEVYGSRGNLTTSADIVINAKNGMGVRVIDGATVHMTNHTLQLNKDYTYGFDTLNIGKITTDHVQISGGGNRTFAFNGHDIHLNNSSVNLTGSESAITIAPSNETDNVVQNITNSQLNADLGVLIYPFDDEYSNTETFNHTMNLNNSTLTGRTALIAANLPNSFLPDEGDINGSVTINANKSTLSGAVVLNNQSANANNNIALNLTNQSTWQMQQNSTLDNLNVVDSTVDLRHATSGNYNTLTINNNLTGNGTFIMNTDIAQAKHDLLKVNGDVSGSHKLLVHNTLTEPTSTNANLTLVETAKPEDAQHFTLANPNGVVEVGKYLYALQHNNGTTWQLVHNSTQATTPTHNTTNSTTNTTTNSTNTTTNTTTNTNSTNTTTNTTNPVVPVIPVAPVVPSNNSSSASVNQNFGFTLNSRLANAQAATLANAELAYTLNSRQTALHREQRLHGLWIQGEHAKTQRDSSTINGGNASGYTDKTNTWQIGYDRNYGKYYAGLLAGQIRHDIDYDVNFYADSKMRGNTWAIYGGTSWGNGWFADGTLRHTRYKAESSDTATDSFRVNSLNAQVGKSIPLNPQWSVVPQAAITLGHLSGSDLIDNGALLQTRLGGDMQGNFALVNGGKLQPKVGMYYLGDHRKARVIMPNGETFVVPTAGHRFAVKTGVDWLFTTNTHLSANIQTEHGSHVKRPYVLDVGLTYHW